MNLELEQIVLIETIEVDFEGNFIIDAPVEIIEKLKNDLKRGV